MNNYKSYNNPHCLFVKWIISVRNISAKSLWVVVDAVVGVDLEFEKDVVNWVELRESQ